MKKKQIPIVNSLSDTSFLGYMDIPLDTKNYLVDAMLDENKIIVLTAEISPRKRLINHVAFQPITPPVNAAYLPVGSMVRVGPVNGIVTAILIEGTGAKYQVSWWCDNVHFCHWFLPFQLLVREHDEPTQS